MSENQISSQIPKKLPKNLDDATARRRRYKHLNKILETDQLLELYEIREYDKMIEEQEN